jgi:hypothetical protein
MRLIFTQTIISFQKMCRINRSVAISENGESDARIAQFDRVTMAEPTITIRDRGRLEARSMGPIVSSSIGAAMTPL